MRVKRYCLSIDPITYQAAKELVKVRKYRSISHLFEDGALSIIKQHPEIVDLEELACRQEIVKKQSRPDRTVLETLNASHRRGVSK